jgi:molybdenum cofactor cytidylyltransferase
MKFGTIPLSEAEGAILAHSARLPERVLKKGRVLSADDIDLFKAAGVEEVVAARLEDGDIAEDPAARRISEALAGDNVKVGDAFTGRCNLIAEKHGVIVYDQEKLNAVNLIDETITVATTPAYEVVTPGQLIATIKIIPFAVSDALVKEAEASSHPDKPLIDVYPFDARSVGLILTRLPGMKESILDKTVETAAARVEAYGSTISEVIRCGHVQVEVTEAITELQNKGIEIILIFGASAVVDRHDVLPAAVVDAGGTVDHFGMPVDPGNLLFIGTLDNQPVVGMPGCARSPKLNGFDWVLWRLLAGVPVTPKDIMLMGGGGLLKEISERGQLRQSGSSDTDVAKAREPRIAALILAAGASRRMGAQNKLLVDVDGKPMVRRVAETVAAAKQVASLTVITGFEEDQVKEALSGLDVTFVHNADYADGLSTSVKTGLAALSGDADGFMVCLGDMPLISTDILDQLIKAFDPVEGRSICVPVHGRKRGNPVIWSNEFKAEMAGLSGDVGARYLLEEHADRVFEVPIEEDSVLFDVDTPERLKQLQDRLNET